MWRNSSPFWKKKIYMQLKNNFIPRTLYPVSLLLFFLFLLTSCHPDLPTVSEGNEDHISLEKWLDESRRTPGELLTEELIAERSVVLTQDNLLRADTVNLMKAIVPVLYVAGVRELGLFFLDSAQQIELDAYILDGSDKTRAEKLLFSANAALGYSEYCDFILYVREFNGNLDAGEEAIRLLALGENGKTSPEILTLALENQEQKPPVFLWIPAEDLEMLPENLVILSHHGPGKNTLRWNGLIENVCAQRDIRDCTFAFRTTEPPFPGWNDKEAGIKADIYIVTPFPYRAVQPIPDFITPETAARALTFFPEISMEKPLSWIAFRMNRITRKAASGYNHMVENLNLPGVSE